MKLKNQVIANYLRLVEDTESPPMYHLWSLLYMASAALGRRNYYMLGDLKIFPNLYVLLVGSPGVRKSSALAMAKRLVEYNSQIRFSPDDTGGQRQGLLSAMMDENALSVALQETSEAAFSDVSELLMNDTGDDNAMAALDALDGADFAQPHLADARTLYVVASEFSTFIGTKNLDLITFLTKMWDGEEYNYRLKTSQCKLREPLMGIIGGTTPVALTNSMPLEAAGQGFLSRVILVYAERHKSVPRPRKLSDQLFAEVRDALVNISKEFTGGSFIEEPDAAEYLDSLYEAKLNIDDGRFEFYKARRHTHLVKVVMACAALRGSCTVTKADIEDANTIMDITERAMPDALGEFGLSPHSVVRQKMLDFIKTKPTTGCSLLELRNHVAKDIRPGDFAQILRDLLTDKSVISWCNESVNPPEYRYTVPEKARARAKVSISDVIGQSLFGE